MGQVLQHHRLADHAGSGSDDSACRYSLHAEVGEGLVHSAVEGHLLELLGDDPTVHLFGHLDELDLAVQFHQGQVELVGESRGRLGQWSRGAQFDDDTERSRIGEPAQVPGG